MGDSISEKMKVLGEFKYELKLANYKALNRTASKKGIVFIGDSITDEFPVHEMLRSDRPIYNRGISGENTQGLLGKLKHVVFDLEPVQVFLMIGTNDLHQGVETEKIVCRIEEICANIKGTLPETKLIVQSVFPVNPAAEPPNLPFSIVKPRTNETIRAMNEAIRRMAVKMNVPYIDQYSRLLDEEGLLKADYTYDGLHLSIAGYEVVKEEVQKFIID